MVYIYIYASISGSISSRPNPVLPEPGNHGFLKGNRPLDAARFRWVICPDIMGKHHGILTKWHSQHSSVYFSCIEEDASEALCQRPLEGSNGSFVQYPLVIKHIAIETGHRNSGFSMVFPLKMVISHSYVSHNQRVSTMARLDTWRIYPIQAKTSGVISGLTGWWQDDHDGLVLVLVTSGFPWQTRVNPTATNLLIYLICSQCWAIP